MEKRLRISRGNGTQIAADMNTAKGYNGILDAD
jgi:hypothetical protein